MLLAGQDSVRGIPASAGKQAHEVDEARLTVRESMVIVDGGEHAELPGGSGGPVLAGDEAIFVAGRVAADAPTLIRIGDEVATDGLVLAYSGSIRTSDGILRIASIEGHELVSVPVPTARTTVRIFLTNLQEPDEIAISIAPD